MTAELKSSLVTSLQAAASQAGLVLVSVTQGSDFHGQPTAVFELGLPNAEAAGRTLKLELTDGFEFDKPELLPAMTAHLADEAKRLRNPRPDCYVTLGGLLFERFGHIPAEGEHVRIDDWDLRVVEMDKRRVAQVVATRTGEPADDESPNGTSDPPE